MPAFTTSVLSATGVLVLSLPQLKILQEVITLAALCMLGAVYFMFRGEPPAS